MSDKQTRCPCSFAHPPHDYCDGRGHLRPDKPLPCWLCAGTGKTRVYRGEPSQGDDVETCEICGGTGREHHKKD